MSAFQPEVPSDWTPELRDVLQLEHRLRTPRPSFHGVGGDDKPLTDTELDLRISNEIVNAEKKIVELKLLRQIREERARDAHWWIRVLNTLGGRA